MVNTVSWFKARGKERRQGGLGCQFYFNNKDKQMSVWKTSLHKLNFCFVLFVCFLYLNDF